MKTVIYIDILVAVNMILTSLLLNCTAVLAKKKIKRCRLIISSCIGAIYSFIILAPDIGLFFSVIVKLCMCLSIVCIAFAFKKLTDIIITGLMFFLVSTAFAGIIFVIKSVFSSDWLIVQNGCVYFGFSLTQILLSALVCYIIVMICIRIINKRKTLLSCKTEISVNGNRKKLNALVDTGNSLYDPIGMQPVCIIGFEMICDLLPIELHDYFKGNLTNVDNIPCEWLNKILTVPVQTAVDNTLMPALRIEEMTVETEDCKQTFQNCIFAVVDTELLIEEDMILHPNFASMENIIVGRKIKNAEINDFKVI